MNRNHPGLIVAALMALLIAACTSTTPYQSTQAKLQQQIATLSALDQKLSAGGNETQRQQLLVEREQAMRYSIALLKAAHAERLAKSRECIQREKNQPSSSTTCYELESAEETQARMTVVLLDQMAMGHTRQ
ncbi:MAG: hypothetical protein V4729_09020 [Pseudomonadota bacterium]